jgi:hypothetical protein
MNRCIATLLFLLCGLSASFAQDRTTKAISIGPELNITQRSAYTIGYGISGKLELPVSNTLSVVVTGAYNRLRYRNSPLPGVSRRDNDSFIPLKGGVRYFIDPRFYTEGELGTVIGNGSNGNFFTYSIGTGFLIPLGGSKSNMVDIGLRYEDWSQNRLQQFGIRAAYRFGF